MVKLVTLFLVVLAVLAVFGRLRMPSARRGIDRLRRRARTCPHCGTPRVGRSSCPCGKDHG